MKTNKIELTFTMGIPGSGKTHWCESRIANRKPGVVHFNSDIYLFAPGRNATERILPEYSP